MCGIAGIVSIRNKPREVHAIDLAAFRDAVDRIEAGGLAACRKGAMDPAAHYLGGADLLQTLWSAVTA